MVGEPVPALGIEPSAWPGVRRLSGHAGVRSRQEDGSLSASRAVSYVHSYVLPGERSPAVVIAQSPVYPGRPPHQPGAAISTLLRRGRREGVARPDHPVSVRSGHAVIEGCDIGIDVVDWGDARLGGVAFTWRGSTYVDIASWLAPLDALFLAALTVIGDPLEPLAGRPGG
ncbi:hypothetical protein [Actinospica robiniae]|uniref:hypothetical protein n=1 Tax=Actinospica robiniae TaxID=304901 RepID=UPI000412D3AF|nr:hypothetical protein [Actinospica robiniae]